MEFIEKRRVLELIRGNEHRYIVDNQKRYSQGDFMELLAEPHLCAYEIKMCFVDEFAIFHEEANEDVFYRLWDWGSDKDWGQSQEFHKMFDCLWKEYSYA